MVYSPGTQTVTLRASIPARLAADLGIAAGTAGDVLHLPYRDALALVQGGYGQFGSVAETQDDYDDEGGHVDLVLAPGSAIGANQTITGAAIEARSGGHARLLVGTTAASSAAIEQSIDGQTWYRPVAATAIAAGASALLEQGIAGRYVRGVIIGGPAAGTGGAQLTIDA